MTGLPKASASLWLPPDGPLPGPPIVTKPAVLPIGQLTWEDAERLFARLLETEVDVERATLFGLPGQAQDGIDVYGRLIPTGASSSSNTSKFASLQSRRIKNVTAAAIEKAVEEFLAGEWAARSARFYYATSSSLRDTRLDAAIRDAHDALQARGIEFIPWGLDEVSDRLRDHPRIIDDFFGRGWVESFCTPQQLGELSRRVTAAQARHLRTALSTLYRAAFRAHGAPATVTATGALPYIVLDTVSLVGAQRARTDFTSEADEIAEPQSGVDEFAPYSFIRRRTTRPRRPATALLAAERLISRTPADDWMAAAKLRLLIGAPGSGKSSFLMFAAADLLSSAPQSAALQRAHAGALPLWLPFAFLCRHLEESTSNSVVSAVRAWVTQQGGEQTWSIIEPALEDDRVVLFVDGVDEWNDITKADQALGLVESFVTQRNIPATLSARPYALTKLGWTQAWSKAALAPLDANQKLLLVHRALTEAEMETSGTDTALSSPAAETFLAELDRVPALEPLAATPLFLCVLAKSWRGEALSPQRFRLFSDLVRLLIERHPQMRRRASSANGSEFPTVQMQTVLRGVAFRARQETGSAMTSRQQMERWFGDELAAPEGLGYPLADAKRIAEAALSQAEDEYGLLVPQGVGVVGFIHRVLLDQLAGEHLASLSPDEVSAYLSEHAGDPGWRDVLIAGLTAQVSPHVNAALLGELCTNTAVDEVDRWELVAAAIAADVAITSGPQSTWVTEIIARAAEHHDGNHRAELARSLVSMTRHPALRARLLPIFSRWLAASHPEPVAPIWALRDAEIPDADALNTLHWALRHEDAAVQLNAAHAIATRFGGDPTVRSTIVERVHNGGSSTDQAFALLCLGTGWPDASELPGLITWARAQPTPELRICALHLEAASKTTPPVLSASEQGWLRDFLRYERLRPDDSWISLAKPFIEEAVKSQPGIRKFVLEILERNGRDGGDRYLAWHLACTTFQDDDAIRNWVAGQLGNAEKRGLILYNLSLMPDVWRSDPDFARMAAVTVRRDAATPTQISDVLGLSTMLPDEEALEALLPALDSFRPVASASALWERFRHDARALEPIKQRLMGEYSVAARFAPMAIDVLGTQAGVERLVELLRHEEAKPDGERRVVIAKAVADAWVTLSREPDSAAAEILASYDADELARRCASVGIQMLTWHVGSVIAAWPHHPAVIEFALNALRRPRSLTRGIVDPAPAAILRAYAPALDPCSRDMVAAVLAQLAYLPADTREVLTLTLAESDLPPTLLIELLSDWDYDPDIWVQRAAITGLARRFNRYRLSADADASQIEITGAWLREQVRRQLCVYGQDYEDRRQNAWVAMLILGEPALHDGLDESIGEPGRPGVRLTHVLGGVDLEFVDLVNATWEKLAAHFGEDDLFLLLSNVRGRDNGDEEVSAARRGVLVELTRAPAPQPRIHDLIVSEAEADSAFRRNPSFLVWSHRTGRNDSTLFESCLETLSGRRFDEEPDGVYEILVDADAWDMGDDTANALIQEHPRFGRDQTVRALFAERFPSDPITARWYHELEVWFQTDPPREDRQWQDTLAVAIRASPAEVLPTIVERAHAHLALHGRPELAGYLTAPLLRRLRRDPDAVAQVREALRDPFAVRADTPIWASSPPIDAPSQDVAYRRSYLHARVLQRAGLLDAHLAAETRSALLANAGDVIVHDLFLDVEASLRSISGVLLEK